MPEPIIMYKRRATKLCLIGFLIVGISVFFVLFRPVNCFASASAMEVLFLGTGGPRPDGRAASCNLILVDASISTAAALPFLEISIRLGCLIYRNWPRRRICLFSIVPCSIHPVRLPNSTPGIHLQNALANWRVLRA